ncbi:hypothetical protein KEM54_000364 [Ascosphaera aggregata]|nr:hypothetical protein KEM54_000364 [Ascosphaera aggregata]
MPSPGYLAALSRRAVSRFHSSYTNTFSIKRLRRTFATTRSNRAAWGFIGLGQMGYQMARNLRAKLSKDDKLVVYDTDIKQSQMILADSYADGVSRSVTAIGGGPRDVVMRSDTVITALPGPKEVESTFSSILDPSSSPPLSHNSSSPRLFIDCSTIDPTTSRAVAHLVQSTPNAGHFIDAPMSGGVIGAKNGTLSFMMGHTPDPNHPDLAKRAENALLHMGVKVWHMGPQGAGLAAKLINNYMLGIVNIATSEGMYMGQKLGLDPAVLSAMIASSTGRNWSNDVNNPVPGVDPAAPASKGYAGGFGIGLMKKDLGLFEKGVKEVGGKLELMEKVLEVYKKTAEKYAGKDFSVVYEYLRATQEVKADDNESPSSGGKICAAK